MLINEGISIIPIKMKKNKLPNRVDKNFELLNKFNKIINHRLIICMIDEIKSYYRRSYYILIELIYINDWFFKDKYSFITKYKECLLIYLLTNNFKYISQKLIFFKITK